MKRRVLVVDDLRVSLPSEHGAVTPVDGVSFHVDRGEALGIVGESGAGKSLTLRALLGLVPTGAGVTGALRFSTDGGTPTSYDPIDVRGQGISMVFQDPMTALNPTMRVGTMIAEGPRFHEGLSRTAGRARACELMERVGIPNPTRCERLWPHQLSGGLRQRVMIAVAISTNPTLLLCDEPTTALDVSVQDQILGLLQQLRAELGMSIVFVSHDLGVVAELCDRLAVMYAGQIIETGATDGMLGRPGHPYTAALLASVPSFDRTDEALRGIPGQPPDLAVVGAGCRFADRCSHVVEECRSAPYSLAPWGDGETACIRPAVLVGEGP